MESDGMSMTPQSSMHSSMHDIDVLDAFLLHHCTDDDDGDQPCQDDMCEEEEEEEEGGDHLGVLQMSRLSLETFEDDDDADDKGEALGCDDDDDAGGSVTWGFPDYLSLPGTPRRLPGSTRSSWTKDYASESEVAAGGARKKSGGGDRPSACYDCHRRSGRTRERRLDRAWEIKRWHCAGGDCPDSHSGGGGSPCVVVRPKGPGAGCMWMDMEEVKACRDLGLELPCDWTVEIPPGAFAAAAAAAADGGGGDSPVGNWRISSPGEDQREMKARLRVWAQAVALASASRLSN